MILQSNVVFRMKHYWRRELKDPVQLGVGINPLMKSLAENRRQNPLRRISKSPMTSESHRIITIHSDTIELNQVLKFEGLVCSGGEAKQIINDGLVSVNGETETRKRRKLVHGDSIGFNGETYQAEGSTA